MEPKELKKMPHDALEKLLTETTTELSKARFLIGGGESKKVRDIRRLRVDRAQILTEFNKRAAAEAKA